ncbi:MAG TPA: RidA family protein [Chloroflexia bacterium]|nr:RidA family protein [Chloroflexia bacterium]
MRQRVHTDKAPETIGPYSQAVVVNGMVYTAGQVGINPATHKLVEGGIEEQTRQVLDNLKAVLEAAGGSLQSVVKTTVFHTYMGNFAAMNAIYGRYFDAEPPPARSTVQVADLPLGAMIEIECIAALEQA